MNFSTYRSKMDWKLLSKKMWRTSFYSDACICCGQQTIDKLDLWTADDYTFWKAKNGCLLWHLEKNPFKCVACGFYTIRVWILSFPMLTQNLQKANVFSYSRLKNTASCIHSNSAGTWSEFWSLFSKFPNHFNRIQVEEMSLLPFSSYYCCPFC